jgi:hypothetical protein
VRYCMVPTYLGRYLWTIWSVIIEYYVYTTMYILLCIYYYVYTTMYILRMYIGMYGVLRI